MQLKTEVVPFEKKVTELSVGVAAELAELALVNQVDQLTHLVNDVTTDKLMTTPYCDDIGYLYLSF